MKNKLKVLKQCIKSDNLAEQLNNIQFTENDIIVFSSEGNLINCKNDTEIRGRVNGTAFINIINSFRDFKYIDSEDNLIIKEGRKKAKINKYISMEQDIELSYFKDEKTIKVNEQLKESIELSIFSAKESILNGSGDGIMIDCGKFSKIYSTNGKVLTIGNIFVKNHHNDKIFIPIFIAINIIKYYNKDISELSYCDNYIKYYNGEFTFISLCNVTEERVNTEDLYSKITSVNNEITLNQEIKDGIIDVINLSNDEVMIELSKDRGIKVISTSNIFDIENELIVNIGIDCNILLNRNYLKYAIDNFDIMTVVDLDGTKLLKFKKGKNAFIISPIIY